MSPSPPELLALTCSRCGLSLDAGPETQVFVCRSCGLAFEPEAAQLREMACAWASPTSQAAPTSGPQFLAFWRFPATVSVKYKRAEAMAPLAANWAAVVERAHPNPARLYVPAFALAKVVVQQLGVALVRAQPRLSLRKGLPVASGAEVEPHSGFGLLSPVLLTEADARLVAHFVYLALEALLTPGLRSIDYRLDCGSGELVFLPAVCDRQWVRGSNWRLLIQELDVEAD